MGVLTVPRRAAALSLLGFLLPWLALPALVLVAGCEDTAVPLVDGGVGRRLEIIDPPGAQLGLRYRQQLELAVRAVRDDAEDSPLVDEPVRFAIFDDPAGSTLARDVVMTGQDGVARVLLTAGNQEGSFRVRASCAGASDVEFAVATSMLRFVDIDVKLTDPLPGAGAHALTTLLYTDRSCASIAPSPKPQGASRALTAGAAASATLSFVNLLSRSYALVGRVEHGEALLAQGCVDVDRSLVPPGAHLAVSITMRAVSPRVSGSFALTSTLGTSRQARADALFAPIDALDRCETHLGQLLLDELRARVPMARAALIDAHRGAPAPSIAGASTVSCRPAALGAGDTLDAELDTLLATTMPGQARAALITDLDAILSSGQLRSQLTLAATARRPEDGEGAPERLVAGHHAERVSLALGAALRDYDLALRGLPVLDALGIDAAREAGALALAQHELPIGLPALWGVAFGELSLDVRLPGLPDASLSAWVSAVVAATQRNGKMGCAAIEDLVCERTDPQLCTGSLLTHCANSVAAVGARLDAVFAAALPLRLRGSARIVDDDGDLVGDRLTPGSWQEEAALATELSFSGERTSP